MDLGEREMKNKKQDRFPIVVYLDESQESAEAKRLLDEAETEYVVSNAILEITSTPPILCHGIGRHQGLDSIKAWLCSELVV